MQRKIAGGNIRFGVILTLIAILMLATAFIWATLYLGTTHG